MLPNYYLDDNASLILIIFYTSYESILGCIYLVQNTSEQ